MGLTKELANSLFEIQELTERDADQLKTLILDFFAAAYAGYRCNRSFNHAVERVLFSQGGRRESCILFQKHKYPARTAAFINSVYGHGAELDDGNKKAGGHAGVHIIPAVFALADRLMCSSNDVFLALATGYEAYIRISSAAQPGMINRGFHSTGMAGTLASAAACSRLYHMETEGIENAIALATTMSGGLLSYGDSRPEIKPLNPGKAAENGVFAASLANEGIQGPSEALEGPNGWFHAVTDKVEKSFLKPSDHLLLHECYLKLYPSCRHTHCVIDAGIDLHGKVSIEKIEKINVFTYPNAIKLAGLRVPRNPDETKFSIPYTLACALSQGTYGIESMEPGRLTPEILNLIRKTELIVDPEMEDRMKGIRGARVQILMRDGEAIEETVSIPRGEPERPLSKEDLEEKLIVCAQSESDSEMLNSLIWAVRNLDKDERFSNPMKLVRKVHE